ncbi:Miniconductance mechanosensitive channel YbdG [Saliniradius amylolyticus]|uniref:Miniconductance mechanosensitive channel YbdG n=1 Tax=Saliniradius amylolyticus TaxID=2183582 RepID=A0A2S2E0V5_9ALTE|nr:mechanosensitive ion channel family protein [Saliniradius amylolyticus]AWL11253.1 Miniconductance mechanosensitive channel YbdG [Saliniradius amylolyticus]
MDEKQTLMQGFEQLPTLVLEYSDALGLPIQVSQTLYLVIALSLILVSSWLGLVVGRYLLTHQATRLIAASKSQLDDELKEHHFFSRLAHLIPVVLIYVLAQPLLKDWEGALSLLLKLTYIYGVVVSLLLISALLNTAEGIYNHSPMAKRVPITNFIQVGKLIFTLVAIILVVADLIDKSPTLVLSGLGAITAVLLLIFRDTILGLVAGVNIVANRMVNTGDWIELSKYGANGTVIAVGLTTVKVQNWDNTITTVPTYALIGDSFINWRGMQESGGRRIKRAIYLDIHSIRFCDESMLEDFAKIRYIKAYINKKREEVARHNQDEHVTAEDLVNARRLTNIGTFRAYIIEYLKHHPKVNQELTLMARQLAPTEFGLPMEVYCFSKDKIWVEYEGVQSDIMDHLLAILPAFGLRAYQRISDRQTGN